jgi:hypothetical protein
MQRPVVQSVTPTLASLLTIQPSLLRLNRLILGFGESSCDLPANLAQRQAATTPLAIDVKSELGAGE